MVYGIGADLVQIDRMEKSLKSEAFWNRVFGEEERQLLFGLGEARRMQSAAANFAAKEAFLKAIGTGIGGFALHEIQAVRKQGGAPGFSFTGNAAQWVQQNGIKAHLTLSHDAGLAQAFVVLERTEK